MQRTKSHLNKFLSSEEVLDHSFLFRNFFIFEIFCDKMEENHTSATALSKLANSCGVVENVIVHEVSFFYNLQGSVDLVAEMLLRFVHFIVPQLIFLYSDLT